MKFSKKDAHFICTTWALEFEADPANAGITPTVRVKEDEKRCVVVIPVVRDGQTKSKIVYSKEYT